MTVALIFLTLALPAQAQQIPVPRSRPDVVAAPGIPLPRPRPAPGATLPETAAPAEQAPDSAGPVEPEGEPEAPKPPRIYQTACPAVLAGMVEARTLPPLAENQCGERSPLAVTGVLANGRMVPFSGEATLNCGMATALPAWAAAVDSYLVARENTRIARILVGTSYMCRPRNHVVDADVSEHGFANGLDVVGFELEDGRTVTLPEGWADALSPEGRLLRFAHDAGCASFTTTLGPEANAQHGDHLHLDLGCHGQNCTGRLCE